MKLLLLILVFCFLPLISGYGQTERSTNLSLTQTVSAAPYFKNNLVTITITARNNGPDDATNVNITNALSANLTFVSAAATAGNYNKANGFYAIGGLANGATATLTLVVKISAAIGDKFSNTAVITGAETDPVPANNTAALAQLSVTAVPALSADLFITKAVASTGPFKAGDNIIYTITVTNNSSNPATNVRATDILPPNLTFVSASATIGSYVAGTGIYTIGNLGAGASAILTVTATINTSGAITNIASVSGSPSDPDNTNNADTIQTCVLPWYANSAGN